MRGASEYLKKASIFLSVVLIIYLILFSTTNSATFQSVNSESGKFSSENINSFSTEKDTSTDSGSGTNLLKETKSANAVSIKQVESKHATLFEIQGDVLSYENQNFESYLRDVVMRAAGREEVGGGKLSVLIFKDSKGSEKFRVLLRPDGTYEVFVKGKSVREGFVYDGD